MGKRMRSYLAIELTVGIALAVSAYLYESYTGIRLWRFLVLMTLWLTTAVLRTRSKEKGYAALWVVGTAAIMGLEFTSRYILNYFLHGYYLLQILELAFKRTSRRDLILGGGTILVSLYKYGELIQYRGSVSAWAELAFFAVLNTMALVVISLLAQLRAQKENQERLYEELRTTHEALKQSTNKLEELAAVEERNRIAGELHDTLGHDMTGLIMQLEMTAHYIESKPQAAAELLGQSKESAREALRKVRNAVQTLQGAEDADMKRLIRRFSNQTGIAIQDRLTDDLPLGTARVLYRVIQEALTNTARHSNATAVHIDLEDKGAAYVLSIQDNGSTSESIQEGFGLQNMKRRIGEAGGRMNWTHDKGFRIDITLPKEGVK